MAVELNSPDPAALDPPIEAAFALGGACEDEGRAVDEELRARACSGPNSRLTFAVGVNVGVGLAGPLDAASSGRPTLGAAS